MVARIKTIRLVVGITNNYNWPIYQMDVKFMFLNGPFDDEEYVGQPPVFFCEKPRAEIMQVEESAIKFEASSKSLE